MGMDLTDRFGRVHDYLRISLTERCNLRCFYCMPENGIDIRPRSEFMRTEELMEIVQQFVTMGIRKVRLTGGEPLIRKDAGAIIRQLGQLPIELGITTNGVLVDQFINDFRAAGIRSVNVSLDSLDHARQAVITRRDYFDRIHQNILLLIQHGFDLKINVVVIRGVNEDELVDFVRWTRHVPIEVRFIEFMPFDGNAWEWQKKVPASEMMDLIEAGLGHGQINNLGIGEHGTAQVYQVAGHVGRFGMISPVTHPFCNTCNRLRLTADGHLKNCLFDQTETNLLAALRSGQPLLPLIVASVQGKHAARGGMESFEQNGSTHLHRSMVAIGG